MARYSVIRFGDSINNAVTGPSVHNWCLLTELAAMRQLGDTHFITYRETGSREKYPVALKLHEVSLEQSAEVASRMPLQPHFCMVNAALKLAPVLRQEIIAVAVSGRYAPQAHQFASLLNSTTAKRCHLVIEGHGSDVCGYQLREFEALYGRAFEAADLMLLVETPFAIDRLRQTGIAVRRLAVVPTVVRWEHEMLRVKRTGLARKLRARLSRANAIPPTRRLVVMTGRFQPEKGHDLLIRAAPAILERVPDAHIVLGGSGLGTLAAVKRMIRGLRRVTVLGEIPFSDYYALLASASVIVIPSIEVHRQNKLFFAETGPRTVVEAMAAASLGETALVASDSGGTPWKFDVEHWTKRIWSKNDRTPRRPSFRQSFSGVQNARDRALLFRQGDVDALTRAVCAVLEDDCLRARLNRGATDYVAQYYRPSKIATTYRRVLESTLGL